MMNSLLDDHTQDIEHLLKNLYINKGSIEAYNKSEDFPLTIAYNLPDKRYLKTLLKHSGDNLKILNDVKCQNLLMRMVDENNWNVLLITLDKCEISESNETFLINISISTLKKDKVDVFKQIIKRCFKKNELLSNGESFLTNSLKIIEDERLIIMIINSKYFDINLPNNLNETPLILACERLLFNVVEALYQNNCVIDYDNMKFINVTVNQSQRDSEIASKILKLFLSPRILVKIDENEELLEENPEEMCIELSSEQQTIIDILRLMVIHNGDLIKEESSGVNIISLAYNLTSKSIFIMFLGICNDNLPLLCVYTAQSLINKIISDKNYELLICLLKKCEIRIEDDELLLQITFILLTEEKSHFCNAILDRCINIDKILLNGETFITNIFKENINKKMILDILKLKLFNLNTFNKSNETCLIIACEKLMADMVEILLQYGCDPSIMNYKAIDVTVTSAINGSKENIENKNRILNMFFMKSNLMENNGVSNCENIKEKESSKIVHEIQLAKGVYYSIMPYDFLRSGRTSLLEMFIFAFFATSDFMDYIFLNGQLENNNHINELKYFLSSEIVYPLRKHGFIEGTKIYEFIGIIKKNKIISLMRNKEIDIKDVTKIISVLALGEDMLRFVNSADDSSYLSLVAKFSQPSINISIQDLLNIYMAQNSKILSKIPANLILEIPRDKKCDDNFNNIIPSNSLDLSYFFIQHYNICGICKMEATMVCSKCMEMKTFNVEYGFRCNDHICSHTETRSLPPFDSKSKFLVEMNLYAIICYEKDHFIVYVKENNISERWFSFNSINNHHIPIVMSDNCLSNFLNGSYEEKQRKIFGRVPLYLRTILNDSYIFFYENSTVTCY